MTVTDTDSHQHIPRFFGLSTDTKPVGVPVASTFTETDTQEEFVYDGAEWTRGKTVVVEQVGTITVGEVRATSVLLGEILTQLKIQNAHLEMVTGETISEEELDAS